MISRIFIERPRLAMVVSLVIVLAGLLALFNIPVAEYPAITPPEIRVEATYPGANAEVVAASVAAPLESAVNGVEHMIYMSSTCNNNGGYSLSVTFEVGTDSDIAQVNVMNRVKQAEPKLPTEVVKQGLSVRTRSPDILGMVSFYSPKETRDKLFMANYVNINIKDVIARINGVSEFSPFGSLDYSMRIWMDPERLTSLGLTADDIVAALKSQNIQAAVGSVGSAPSGGQQILQYTLRAKGRLDDVSEFENIVVRTNQQGGVLRLKDVARVELGSQSYAVNVFRQGKPVVGAAVYRASGANALETMTEVRAVLQRLSKKFPSDMTFIVNYDSTKFVDAAIEEIVFTLAITFMLVVGVTYLFLQDWRATLIPTLTIPVSLIGTFALMLVLGYSVNIITLFALILAIGLVVDDAIVVVENVQRLMGEEGLGPKEAALKAMQQVTGPVIAMTLVLLAVFVPVGFMPGTTGKIYEQFAVTICVAVLISGINALTLSPALCSLLLRPPRQIAHGPLAWFSKILGFSRRSYLSVVGWLVRRSALALLCLGLVCTASYALYRVSPTSFLPSEDKGVIFVDVELPQAASLARTTKIIKHINATIKDIPGVDQVLSVAGVSLIAGVAENRGAAIVQLKSWEERTKPQEQLEGVINRLRSELGSIPAARVNVFTPPAIMGMGMMGGFDFRLQAMQGQSPQDLGAVTRALLSAANQVPEIFMAFSTFNANMPQVLVELDRVKAQTLGVPVSRIFSTLQSQMGSRYVNDFNLYDRQFRVTVQADTPFRNEPKDVTKLYVRSDLGYMVPLSSLVNLSMTMGPESLSRYNQFPTAQINGQAATDSSSGQAMAAMGKLAARVLPEGYGYEWSSQSYQESKSSGQTIMLLGLAFLFSYLFLVAQYESWTIPLSVILSVSVAVLGALLGLMITGLPISIYAQIGMVLLVGLSSKNAILIVEFAKVQRDAGLSVQDAALAGAKLRFRAVLMTAFSFILGVFPLVIATGAGAASQRAIGVTVFWGMLAATVVGIILIPGLYAYFQNMRDRLKNLGGKKAAPEKNQPDDSKQG